MKTLTGFVAICFLLLIGLCFTACGSTPGVVTTTQKQNILAIGDSITVGWTPYAAIKSENEFNWRRLTLNQQSTWPENARNTNYTLRNVNTWLDWYPDTDIVIWNNGVWNCTTLGYVTPGEDARNYGTTGDQYQAELIQIATILKSRVKRVIFNTTTNCKNSEASHNQDVFNAIAKNVLPGLGVEIFDLDAFTKIHDGTNGNDMWWLNSSDVHFNGFGNEYISEEIVHNVLGVPIK